MQKKTKRTSQNNKSKLDFALCITVFLLLASGIVMVLSASAPSALSETGKSYTYFERQLGFAIAGIILMFIISRINYKIYLRFYKLIYVFSVLILLLVLVPKIGSSGGGATRWITLLGIRFQPSEITKIGLVVFYAGYFTEHRDKIGTFKYGFLIPILFLLPPLACLMILQSHLSATILVGTVCITVMLVAGTKIKYIAIPGAIGVAGAVALVSYFIKNGGGGYQMDRIRSWLDPFADKIGDGWQVVQSFYAIGSGGLFGVGLGESKQKYLYIPEPHNDFIFAILAEELGLVGCMVVIILFGIFIWRGILIAMKADDLFGTLLATGIVAIIGLQAMLNIAVVTGSIPNTGISLPFFSYGGTALIITLASVGVLLNISRNAKKI